MGGPLRKIRIRDGYQEPEFRYDEDVVRIVRVLQKAGYECTPEQAREMWAAYSEAWGASWLSLPREDESLLATLEYLFVPIDENEEEK